MARIQIIKDERDCNRCGRKGCAGDILRDRKGGIKAYLVCPGFVKQQDFRVPLLTIAAQNPGSLTALAPVLDNLGLQLDIIPRRPGFRFIVKATDQEVRDRPKVPPGYGRPSLPQNGISRERC